MATKAKQEAQQPLILRAHRLMEAFAKSDDERDFYLDHMEGFIIYADLDKPQHELELLEAELASDPERYSMIPKLTFYETKKIMEGFVNEKVYDIDTKEKLLDIIQSKEARSNFLEFIYDHLAELEKWQQYYQERSRIRIIEWLRTNHFHFVFEEDLELSKTLLEKLKQNLFQVRASKEVQSTRKLLVAKAKTYYSNEALNPRPKRGRPPKQTAKQEVEHQVTTDIYTTVPNQILPFLFTPDITSASSVTFSANFENPELLASKKTYAEDSLESIQQKLATLRSISSKWVQPEEGLFDEDDDEDDEDEDEDYDGNGRSQKKTAKPTKKATPPKNGKARTKVTSNRSASSTPAKSKSKASANARKRHLRPISKRGATVEKEASKAPSRPSAPKKTASSSSKVVKKKTTSNAKIAK